MKVQISGASLRNTKLDSLFHDARDFAFRELHIDAIDYDLRVDLHATSHPEAYGFFTDIALRRGRVEVMKRYFPIPGFWTLFHELVHVEQHARGGLALDSSYQCVWKGVIYERRERSFFEYLRLPWEIEARRKARSLFFRWLRQEWKTILAEVLPSRFVRGNAG